MAMCLLKMMISSMTIPITLLKTNHPTHHHLLLLLPLPLPSLLPPPLPSLLHALLRLRLRLLLLLLLLPANLTPLLAETPNPTNPIFGAVPPNLRSKLPHLLPIPETPPFFRAIAPPARHRTRPPIIPPISIAGVSLKMAATIPAQIPRPNCRNARIRTILAGLRWMKLPCSIRILPLRQGSAVLRLPRNRRNRRNRRNHPLFHRMFHRSRRMFHRILRCSPRLPRRHVLPDLPLPRRFPRGTAAPTCSASPTRLTFFGGFLAPAISARPLP